MTFQLSGLQSEFKTTLNNLSRSPLHTIKKKKYLQSCNQLMVEHLPSTYIILGSSSGSVDYLLCIVYTHLHTYYLSLSTESLVSQSCPRTITFFPTSPKGKKKNLSWDTAASKRVSQAWRQRKLQMTHSAWSIRLPETGDPKENEKKQKQDVEHTGIKLQAMVTYTYRTFSVVASSCGEGSGFGL